MRGGEFKSNLQVVLGRAAACVGVGELRACVCWERVLLPERGRVSEGGSELFAPETEGEMGAQAEVKAPAGGGRGRGRCYDASE